MPGQPGLQFPASGSPPPCRCAGHTPTSRDADPMHDELVVTDLVTRARNGDKQAWDTLVERYVPLIWSICRRHRLRGADANDVGQSVWLHLVDQLDKIRDPAALPGWLATTTRRECGRVLRTARGPHAAGLSAGRREHTRSAGREGRAGVAGRRDASSAARGVRLLPPCCQQLITLLTEDPPMPYAEISARLGIPVGSIGPTRRRCLDKLRRHPAITALTNAGTGTPREASCLLTSSS